MLKELLMKTCQYELFPKYHIQLGAKNSPLKLMACSLMLLFPRNLNMLPTLFKLLLIWVLCTVMFCCSLPCNYFQKFDFLIAWKRLVNLNMLLLVSIMTWFVANEILVNGTHVSRSLSVDFPQKFQICITRQAKL